VTGQQRVGTAEGDGRIHRESDLEALAAIVRLADLEPLARAVMDPAAFDYVAGGAEDEITLAENEAAWKRRRLRPRVLVDVSAVDPSTTLIGVPSALPLAIAPMAAHGLAHPDGEIATARGAASAGVPFILSTTASRSIEAVAAAAPGAARWFQLYANEDVAISHSLVDRAVAAGYGAIVLTVDLPVLGYRERDRRSGFRLPPLGNFAGAPGTDTDVATDLAGDLAGRTTTSLTWDDLATIRSWSSLPLVLKGIMTAEDALLAVQHGVDAIVVSNHGARQLDRLPAGVDVLAEIVGAVGGRAEVWVDGGVRRGLDIAIALALGARGVLLGRPVLWALAAGGQAGVERALAILRHEFEITLALLGAPTPAHIRADHLLG
jgi:isopentenyl diphosphate isomerase/L-lactate dehydrogenase-like FMN-dependent dehydrogenase